VRKRALALWLVASGCSGGGAGSGPPPVSFTGTPGQPAPALDFTDVLLASVSVDGAPPARLIVDTGSPIVNLTPTSFPSASVPNGVGTVQDLSLGSLTFPNLPVIGATLITSPDATVPVAGTLGCTVLCSFVTSLDYQGQLVTLGASPLPSGTLAPVAVPFALEGGGGAFEIPGVAQPVTLPPSRIAVNVEIEGAEHAMILDTGSSFVVVSQAVFAGITSDGRATIGGLSTSGVGGDSSETVTRVKSVVLGGAEVDALPVATDTTLDADLTALAAEVGHPVDGLLGGTYLRDFYVSIDYPNRTLDFARYASEAYIVDVFERVGVGVAAPAAGQTVVTNVFPGTDAASLGASVGDVILAVDGKGFEGIGVVLANDMFTGMVGATKQVQFGAAQSPALANATVALRVDELLPLP
jgi:hypothetical protein